MVYDSLLLEHGGGILSDTLKTRQSRDSAALIIGLGGTGLAALSVLKGKIHQRLIADDPDAPVPEYQGIQLLGIDSDEKDHLKYRGDQRLRPDEFFFIGQKQHYVRLAEDRNRILKDPFLNWMEYDRILRVLDSRCPSGIRQIGRYLLMCNIDALEKTITAKCHTALNHRNTRDLDIYVFAGLAGGTGSGCFLDICYLLQEIAERNSWDTRILGYFFLPDVVNAQSAIASNSAVCAHNEANGYAALKELDYLMSLRDANDWFTQTYSPPLKVRTQCPPVDLCHLVSAQRSDGRLADNGFISSLNVVAEHVMAYLGQVRSFEKSHGYCNREPDNLLREHQSELFKNVQILPRSAGANLCCFAIGASRAEAPAREAGTYLACGFYARFLDAVGRQRIRVNQSQVINLCDNLKLSADEIQKAIGDQMPPLELPDIDRKTLAQTPVPAPGSLNPAWMQSGDDWLGRCEHTMKRNIQKLTAPLIGYNKDTLHTDSLIERVFRALWDLAVDPQYGPYYAARLLNNHGDDIPTCVTGSISVAYEARDGNLCQLDTLKQWVEEAKTILHETRASRKAYQIYMQAAADFYKAQYQVMLCEKTAEALQIFRRQLQELSDRFFTPLIHMLDNLQETFERNRIYLNPDYSSDADASAWQIVTLAEIEPMLKKRVEELSAKELVTDFMEDLLNRSETWLSGSGDHITALIRQHMLTLFRPETDRSLEDYLLLKYPDIKSIYQLAETILPDILEKLNKDFVSMFSLDRTYHPNKTITSDNLLLPASASATRRAAENITKRSLASSFRWPKTGFNDSILALRLQYALPLYACDDLPRLKRSYDQANTNYTGAGIHLYADTGRGTDISGQRDWQSYLPEPVPYSMKPEMTSGAEELLKLYDEAEKRGVISKVDPFRRYDEYALAYDDCEYWADRDYVINITKDFTPRDYTLKMFMTSGCFNRSAYEAELEALEDQIRRVHMDCSRFPLKNDGDRTKDYDIPARCRRDYFLHYPVLQQIVREELKKLAAMDNALKTLKDIKAMNEAYMADFDRFFWLLLCKGITCLNLMEEETFERIAFIFAACTDPHGDERTYPLFDRLRVSVSDRDFPLYHAFLTYRSLDPDESPRREWDTHVDEVRNEIRTQEQVFVAYELYQVLMKEHIDALKEQVRCLDPDTASDILRFYTELRGSVNHIKTSTSLWPAGARRGGSGSQEGSAAFAPDQFWYVWDPITSKIYEVYAQCSATMAYDRSANAWVALHADMYVAKDNAWLPLKSEPFFADI